MSEARFDELVTEHGAALLRVAYLLCRDSAQAEDLVQDALIRALDRWRGTGWPDHPAAYLRKVVLNEYLGWRRRRASTEVVGLPAWEQGIPDPTDDTDARAVMWQLLGKLPARSRAVLVLRYYEALSDREIADQLDCAEATVRSIAARAFTILRAHPALADYGPHRLDKRLDPLDREA